MIQPTPIKTIHNFDLVNKHQLKPKGRFMGFLRDISPIVQANRQREEREILKRIRRNKFKAHSVNMPQFSLIEDCIRKSADQDWLYNGDDEVPYETISPAKAARNIFYMMRKNGYFKK